MWKWLRKNFKKAALVAVCVYAIHLIVEVTIVNTIAAITGLGPLSLV